MDLGGYDYYLLTKCKGKYQSGILVDPLAYNFKDGDIVSVRGDLFHAIDALPLKPDSIDIICMLAVFEHLGEQREKVIGECCGLLKKGGKLILTAPHPWVDHILRYLKFCRIVEGMSLEQHDSCSHEALVSSCINSDDFKIVKHKKFQLGLNNLYVFEKI